MSTTLNYIFCDECVYSIELNFVVPFVVGVEWVSYLGLPSHMSDFDVRHYKLFRSRYKESVLSQPSRANVSLLLNTEEVRGFLFPAQTHLTWPEILEPNSKTLVFPLTQVGICLLVLW